MITIYGKSDCGWCERAKKLCDDYKLDYEYKNIVNDHYKVELFEKLPGVRTVPQIWMNEKHVGGFEGLTTEIENTIGGYGDNGF
tara:strand:+ start:6 stop:257 length:252 start_codon:yes stop_codon:yes gene_type:complete